MIDKKIYCCHCGKGQKISYWTCENCGAENTVPRQEEKEDENK